MITIENNDFVSKIIDCLQKHDLTNGRIKSLYLKLSSLQYEQATFNTALDCISELCDGIEELSEAEDQ